MNHKLKSKSVLLIILAAILMVSLWLAMGRTGSKPHVPLPPETGIKTLPDGRPAPVDPDAAKRGVKDDFGPDTNAIMAFAAALMKPFEHVGKVIDQNGEPIAGATIHWGANNNPNPNASGTSGSTTTDSQGMFIIRSHGLDVYARAAKKGYEAILSDNRKKTRGSDGGYRNGGLLGNTDLPIGTKKAPGILVLRKMGATVPLVYIAEQYVLVEKNGSPVGVDLETGRTDKGGILQVKCWTNDRIQNSEGQYEWKCVISVPGGGLVERVDDSNFQSPAEGYQESVELVPSPEKWASHMGRQYFVKLPDDRYARINIRMRTGGDHFFVLESFLNPTPGDRNLEFDPAKAIVTP